MPVTFDSSYPELLVELVFPAPIGTVDVTEYWIEGSMFHGRRRETDTYEADASFTLDNWDGRFTPGQTAGTYSSGGVSLVRPRVGVRIRATWSGTTYALWRGYVTSWRDNWMLEGQDTTTTVTCTGPQSVLAAWNGQPVTVVGDGELSGARVSRILAAASAAPFGELVATGNVALIGTDLAGNGTTQVLDVVDTEGGAFWYGPDGVATFEDRSSLVLNSRSNTSQVTFSDASVYFRNAKPVDAEDRLYNEIAFTREGGETQVASDSTSQTRYGVRSMPPRSGLKAASDNDVLAVAQFNLARFKDPEFRVGELTIDPATSATLMWPHALGRKIRDRVTVSASVARSGLSVSAAAFVEGVTHTISQMSWETSFAFSGTAAFDGFSASVWDTGVWDTAKWYY